MTAEVDVTGNVTLTDEVTLYAEITELNVPTYLLYTSGGVVYAEIPGEIVELYDSGFDIPVNNSFMLLSYADKAAQAETCLETTAANLNISAVVAQTELMSTTVRQASPFGVIPCIEIEECAITDFVTQGNYNICWAACVATIVNYKNETSLTAEAVATKMKHNYTDDKYDGATFEQTISALSEYGLTYSFESGKLGWSDVKRNVIDDCPFIVGLSSTNYNPTTGQMETWGHMLTGYGYNCRPGDGVADENLRNVQVWDPNGAHYTFAYYASSYSMYGYSWTWVITLVD